MDPRYSLTGLFVGFLIGLTGMGGGSLMTPLLILVLGVQPTVAVGSDLAYSAVTKTDVYHAAILTTAAAAAHMWAGNVDYGLVANLLLGSIPGVLLGSRLARRMPENMLRPVLASVLLLAGLRMI